MRYKIILLFLIFIYFVDAEIYIANNLNYTEYVKQLIAGDTLILEKGTYTEGLRLNNLNGSEGKTIFITGEDKGLTIFIGSNNFNTVSITKCSYLTISNLKLDGQNLDGDAVKAEGTSGNYAHHITLEGLDIINYGNDQQIVGISTKCPAWNWVIRRNTIIGAGTGIYLGNSDGTQPFVNGIIEYNLIMNTVGYNMQIKHQNEGLRTMPGMALNGKTIIRYNVFSKAEGGSSGSMARPCLLVGNFPATGDGMNDYYEIYGNFFWQNPNEALFQGTGNIALYSNIFVNTNESAGFRAVYIARQNNFKPRNIAVFHNTAWLKNSSGGFRMFSADSAYNQYCFGNAAFGPNPVSNFNISYKNITDTYDNGSAYLINLTDIIGQLDCYPLLGKLEQDTTDMTQFSQYTDYDKDFDGNFYNTIYRGAYSGAGQHSGWKLALEQRPDVGPPTGILNTKTSDNEITIYPNPASDYIEINVGAQRAVPDGVTIFDVLGMEVTTPSNLTPGPSPTGEGSRVRIDVSHLSPGVYFVRIGDAVRKFVKM